MIRNGTLACALLIALAAFGQRHDAWKIIGPGGGGTMFYPSVSRGEPHNILFASDMSGALFPTTVDRPGACIAWGGRSQVSYDPNNARTYYARIAGAYRGRGRALWRVSMPDRDRQASRYPPAIVTGILQNDDHATNSIATSAPLPGTIEALAVDPVDAHMLYAVIQGKTWQLFVSRDWGKSWQATADLPAAGRSIYLDPASPPGDRTLYVIGDNSVSVRRNGIWLRGPAPPGVDSFVDATLGFSGGNPVVYAISSTEMFVSKDGGASCTNRNCRQRNEDWRQSLPAASSPW